MLCACSTYLMAGMPPSPAPGAPVAGPDGLMLTPEQHAELQAMELLVEEEMAKMTPEQKAEFEAASKSLAQELEKLKPEELDAFINGVFFGEEAPAPAPGAPAPAPQPMIVQPEEAKIVEPEKPREKPKMTKKHDLALAMINAVINSSNSFLRKISIMQEFPIKLKKWVDQGKLKNWQPNYAWVIEDESDKGKIPVRHKIEEMIQKLNKVKSQDPKTKEYKFLNDFVADEALYNNLGKLQSVLAEREPDIDIDPFGIEPVSKESRANMRAILDSYLEALFILQIPEALDKIFEKYEPEAKRLREIEETAKKKALEESKREFRAEPSIVAGAPEEEFYAPSMPPVYAPPVSEYMPSAAYGAEAPTAGEKAPEGKEKKGKEEKKKEEKKKEEEKKEKKEEKKEEKPKEDEAIRRLIKKFDDNLRAAADKIEGSFLSSLKTYMISREHVDLGDINVISAVKKNLEKAKGNITAIKDKIKKLTKAQVKSYKEPIKEIYDDYKPTLEDLVKEIDDVKKHEAKVTAEKRHVFLGAKAPVKTEKEKKEAKAKREAAAALEEAAAAEEKAGAAEAKVAEEAAAEEVPAEEKETEEEAAKRAAAEVAARAKRAAAAKRAAEEELEELVSDVTIDDLKKSIESLMSTVKDL